MYELVSGALASYLLGDSITQFSLIIGIYLSSMGLGAWLARYITKDLIAAFIHTELLVALIGGASAAFLFSIFEYIYTFRPILFLIVSLIGILVGLEIPLLMRILKDQLRFSDLISHVLSFDYIGALVASILFPLICVPMFGLIKTSFIFGILNALVALWISIIFRKQLHHRVLLKTNIIIVLGILILGYMGSDAIMSHAESSMYPHPIMYSKNSSYQRIVVTNTNFIASSLFNPAHKSIRWLLVLFC